jgi:flagellar biosynthetic protein FlhB
MADDAEKTEPATAKKREDARDKGQVAQSKDVTTVLLLAVGALALGSSLGARLGRMFVEVSRSVWSGTLVRPDSLADYHAILLYHGAIMGLALAPLVLLIMVVGVAANVAQTGWLFTTEALAFKLDKLNPITGLQRMFSLDRLYELTKSIAKLGLVVWILWVTLAPGVPRIFGLLSADLVDVLREGGALLRRAVWIILAVFAAFAGLDFFWQTWQLEKKLRMTKQEVRDEAKQREGDPQVKSRIRQIQREVAQRRMFEAVKDADVVVVNPTHYAVALQYRPPLHASPKVLAMGRNLIALKIRARAEELGIPIVENPPIAQLLYKTAKIDREIPENLFHAVAEVLAYVYKLDPRRGMRWRSA